MRREGIDYAIGEPEFGHGKPLYRLHELAQQPGAHCSYVEGENCADTLATTAGSVSSHENAD